MSETVRDIITEARGVFEELRRCGHDVVSVDRMADVIDRIEKAAHYNPTCINCVAVEKWKVKQAAAKAKKEADHD